MQKKYVLAGMIAAALLAGCDSGDKSATAQQAQPAASQAASKPMTEAEIAAEKRRRVFNPTPEEQAEDRAKEAAKHVNDSVTIALADAGKNEDFSSYLELSNGLDTALLYNSLTETPASVGGILAAGGVGWSLYGYDDKKLTDLLHQYGKSRDAFDQKDIADKIEPLLNARSEAMKKGRFVKIDLGTSTDLATYDFDRKGFANGEKLFKTPQEKTAKQKELYGDEPYLRPTISFGDLPAYKVGLTNGQAFQFLPVEDETAARKLQKYISDHKKVNITIYGVVNELRQGEYKKTEPQRTMYLTVQKLVVTDGDDPKTVLATLGG